MPAPDLQIPLAPDGHFAWPLQFQAEGETSPPRPAIASLSLLLTPPPRPAIVSTMPKRASTAVEPARRSTRAKTVPLRFIPTGNADVPDAFESMVQSIATEACKSTLHRLRAPLRLHMH